MLSNRCNCSRPTVRRTSPITHISQLWRSTLHSRSIKLKVCSNSSSFVVHIFQRSGGVNPSFWTGRCVPIEPPAPVQVNQKHRIVFFGSTHKLIMVVIVYSESSLDRWMSQSVWRSNPSSSKHIVKDCQDGPWLFSLCSRHGILKILAAERGFHADHEKQMSRSGCG